MIRHILGLFFVGCFGLVWVFFVLAFGSGPFLNCRSPLKYIALQTLEAITSIRICL